MTDNKKIRVLHFSSTLKDPGCGIGKYQEQYLAGMAHSGVVTNKFFAISPYQTRVMSSAELDQAMEQLKRELRDYDVLHIQHEFGLYWDDQFEKLVTVAKSEGKKVIVTVHLSPANVKELKPVKLGGLGPHSVVAYLKQLRHHNAMVKFHIVPMRQADLLIVHNEATARSLAGFGIELRKIKKLQHPVYAMPEPPHSDEIATKLHKQPGDVIYCVVGFLHRYKGILDAIRALKFLPGTYKLALIGGIKSDSDEIEFENKVTNLVDELGLHERVYITGFIADDNQLNALIRECDICVYPYDRVYYANASSGSLNLAFFNSKPVIAYPTESYKEIAHEVEGAVVLCQTFAYYELARELLCVDIQKQISLSKEYASKMAWPKMAKQLITMYEELMA